MNIDDSLLSAAEIARLAGVGRAAVGNWRRRHADFPSPAGGSETSPAFRRADVEAWLRASGKLAEGVDAERLWQRLDAFRWNGHTGDVLAGVGLAFLRGIAGDGLRSWAQHERPDLADVLDEGTERDVLPLTEQGVALAGQDPEIFEWLCARYLEARSGQVQSTPPELADLMVELAGVAHGAVLDPTCGPGSLLMAAARAGAGEMCGQDVHATATKLARVRLAVAGVDAEVVCGDSLRADAFAGRQVDAVVSNPPFGQRDWGREELFSDARWEFGLPPRSEPELAWVQHCVAHLAGEGGAVVLLPPGAATRSSGRRIRAELLRRGALRAVIALPPGALPESGIGPQLWVLRGEEQASSDDGLLLVDVSMRTAGRRPDWPAIRQTVLAATADPASVDAATACVVPTIDLLDDDVDVSPQRHLRPPLASTADVASTHDALLSILAQAGGALPVVGSTTPSIPRWTSLGELARASMVTLVQAPSRLDVLEDDSGAVGLAVLTARDVTEGRDATGRTADPEPDRVVELWPGDIVLPLLAARPVARVVEASGAVLGRNLFLVRARPDAFDPWFLAGVLQGDQVLRASSTISGAHRLTPRHIEVPVLPLEEQRPLAEAFRSVDAFEKAMARAASLSADLATALRAGLADGSLRPTDETLPTSSARSTSTPFEGDA